MKITKENETVVIDGEGTSRIYTKEDVVFEHDNKPPYVQFKNFVVIKEDSDFYLDAVSELTSIKKKWWYRLFRKMGF